MGDGVGINIRAVVVQENVGALVHAGGNELDIDLIGFESGEGRGRAGDGADGRDKTAVKIPRTENGTGQSEIGVRGRRTVRLKRFPRRTCVVVNLKRGGGRDGDLPFPCNDDTVGIGGGSFFEVVSETGGGRGGERVINVVQ